MHIPTYRIPHLDCFQYILLLLSCVLSSRWFASPQLAANSVKRWAWYVACGHLSSSYQQIILSLETHHTIDLFQDARQLTSSRLSNAEPEFDPLTPRGKIKYCHVCKGITLLNRLA